MTDDPAWFQSFILRRPQSQQNVPTRSSFTGKPRPQGQADITPVAAEAPRPLETRPTSGPGPPIASEARRPKSFTDFHSAVRTRNHDGIQIEQDETAAQIILKTEVDFEDWFDGLSEELTESSHARYLLYKDQLRLSRQHLDTILDETTSNLELLSTLSASFKAVEAQTSAFQARCENLLAEQKRLNGLADKLTENLQYYNLLDPITRRLNAPGAGHFVRGEDFTHMLANLDDCIEYMQSHPDHREATSYQSRYRLLLTRALTMIRIHFTNRLREISAEASKRIAERQLTDATMSALLYAKFRVGGSELKHLGLEIHRRVKPPQESGQNAQGEYQSLMNELYQSYSAARGRLIVPLVRKRLTDMAAAANTSKDLVAFARTSISYIRGMCMDEYDLWHDWFDGENGLYEYLESMCEPLFDYLRPRTIHETQLAKLCEMCSIIQVRYMDDQDDDSETADSNQLDFVYLIRPALEDAQTRLVFLALAVLRDEIERYKPSAADLECARGTKGVALSGSKERKPPLSGRKSSANGPPTPQITMPKTPTVVDEEGADPLDLQWRYDTSSSYQEWYPTLRKAIWLLSRIYRLVNSTVFDDLAHQIVHQTTLSLQSAANQVSSKLSPLDSQLFLIKQLLILKQQIIAFDIEFVTPEINFDFSNIANTFWELRERGGLFNPRNILRLVGGGLMPRVVENMLDAKAELDGRLRTVINEFTLSYAEIITQPVSDKAAKQKDFSGASAAKSVRDGVQKQVPHLRSKISEYLDDNRVRETLVGAVLDQVLDKYEDFFERFMAQGPGAANVSKKGKSREEDVWDPDSFADFINGFAPARLGSGPDEDDADGSLVQSPQMLSRRTST